MNKIVTGINGGFPLTQEVWEHTHDGIAEAFKGLMSTYGVSDSTAVILSGCQRSVSSGTVTITEGFVSIGGEVCHFPLQTFPEPVAPNDLEYFQLYESFDPAGNVAFETSGNHDTRAIRKAKVMATNSIPTGYTAYSDAKRIYELIREGVNIGVWNTFSDFHNDSFYGPGQTPTSEYRKYLKDIDGFIHLKGVYIQQDDSLTDITMCQLPVGFRPPHDLVFNYLDVNDHTSANYYQVKIKSNGDIDLIAPGAPVNIWLNNIPCFRNI